MIRSTSALAQIESFLNPAEFECAERPTCILGHHENSEIYDVLGDKRIWIPNTLSFPPAKKQDLASKPSIWLVKTSGRREEAEDHGILCNQSRWSGTQSCIIALTDSIPLAWL